MIRLWTSVVAVLAVLFTGPSASAEKRVALVVGNGDYPQLGVLSNPPNDARLMARTLRQLDFDVIEKINVDQKAMKRAISTFGRKLTNAGKDAVGLFYFAGHGVQVNGTNYLIPVKVNIGTEADVDIEAVAADGVQAQMAFAGNRLNIIVMDACRNNPFKRGFRSAVRGLARMSAPRGTLIAYATAPGDVAADGTGTNSPYTKALATAMLTPGLTVERMFKEVRNNVVAATNERQTPWESSSLIGADFYFRNETAATTAEPAKPAAQATVDPKAMDLAFWNSIKDSEDGADFEAYVTQFPDGTFIALARRKAEKLRKAEVVALPQSDGADGKSTDSSELIGEILGDALIAAGNDPDLLASVGELQVEAGDLAGARQSMDKLRRIEKTLSGVYREGALERVAILEAMTGDVTGAMLTANGLPPDDRSQALSEIALVQLRTGNENGARRTMQTAYDIADANKDQEFSVAWIIEALLKIEGVEAGLRAVNSIDSRSARFSVLTEIAVFKAEIGDFEGALETVDRVEEESRAEAEYRAGALRKIAAQQAEAGDRVGAQRTLDLALRAADQIDGDWLRARYMGSVARELAKTGDQEGARRTIEDAMSVISNSKQTIWGSAYSSIAEAQVQLGDLAAAFNTIKALPQENRNDFWNSIAIAQAETGAVKEGLRTAYRVADDGARALALIGIAKYLLEKKRGVHQAGREN